MQVSYNLSHMCSVKMFDARFQFIMFCHNFFVNKFSCDTIGECLGTSQSSENNNFRDFPSRHNVRSPARRELMMLAIRIYRLFTSETRFSHKLLLICMPDDWRGSHVIINHNFERFSFITI